MSKIRRASLFIPGPSEFVRSALSIVGIEANTCGYWPHALMVSRNFLLCCCMIIPTHIEDMCLSIDTPKTINFSFVPNGKLMVFRCSNI